MFNSSDKTPNEFILKFPNMEIRRNDNVMEIFGNSLFENILKKRLLENEKEIDIDSLASS